MTYITATRLLFLGAALCFLACRRHQSPFQHEKLTSLARRARECGLGRVSVQDHWTIGEYASPQSLDNVRVSGHAPFLVRIAQIRSVLTPDGTDIRTWYEAEIIENLWGAVVPERIMDETGPSPPEELRNIPATSFLVRTHGGTVNVNGVLVEQPEQPVDLEGYKRYLMFIRFDDHQDGIWTRTAQLSFGASAVYIYDEPGDVFWPLSTHPTNLAIELFRQSRGSFRALRDVIKKSIPARQR